MNYKEKAKFLKKNGWVVYSGDIWVKKKWKKYPHGFNTHIDLHLYCTDTAYNFCKNSEETINNSRKAKLDNILKESIIDKIKKKLKL